MKNLKITSNPDFSQIEQEVLKFWQENQIFQKSLQNRHKEFVFYDGPPFANGLPHYGHILTGYIKDTVARFKTMCGYRIERRFGWDCHGLPAEMAAQKELQVSSKKEIENYGIDKFNAHCRQSVMKFADKWREYVHRQGRWVDMDNDYKTMDRDFMESTMWAFKTLWDKGLVYESERVMPYSWACETPLSNFETQMDNSYRQKASKSVFVKVKLHIESICSANLKNILQKNSIQNLYAIIWTTTPWTLPSNLALAVGQEIKYTILQDKQGYGFVVARSKTEQILKMIPNSQKTDLEFLGNDLIDIKYQPIFSFFSGHKNAFRILKADFVSDEEGTGIVHIAPAFGEDDFNLCQKEHISPICPVDSAGNFTEQVPDFAGKNVFNANDEIILQLKEKNLWLKTEQYLHNYPFCWRTDTPLIYRTVSSWYVKVTEIAEKLIKNNQEISWLPEHIKNGQFGKWLEGARDWSISRNRFWGTPIPIWKSDNPQFPRVDVYGSLADLQRDFDCEIEDLHRPYIDSLTRPNPDDPSGKSQMVRIPDVFDCWFESGAMPYGQMHYPFENRQHFEQNFPADFIVEYLAQTRGWFYTLHVLAAALFDRPAFKNCLCHGVILDSNGQKLSKRLGNYVDPLEIMNQFGSDALRFAMLSASVVSGGNLHVHKDSRDVKEALKMMIKPFWNAFSFLHTYATANDLRPSAENLDLQNLSIMDKFILFEQQKLFEGVVERLDQGYFLEEAAQKLINFIEILNNWYIRRSKKRFWQNENSQDLQNAHNILFLVLQKFAEISAPFLPFLAEFIYFSLHKLSGKSDYQSVHLQILQKDNDFSVYQNISGQIHEVMQICSGGLAIRNNLQIAVRQPLQDLQIISYTQNNLQNNQQLQEIICDELNIKEIKFILADDFADFVIQEPKINFKAVAKKIPQKIKQIMQNLRQNLYTIEGDFLYIADEKLQIEEDFELIIKPKDGNINNLYFLRELQMILILNTELNPELIDEGWIRWLIRCIQETRKNAGLQVQQKIVASFVTEDQNLLKSLQKNQNTIQKTTFIKEFSVNKDLSQNDFEQEFTLDKTKLKVVIKKIN